MAIDELESLVLREFDLIFQTVQSYLTRSSITHRFRDVLWEALARLSPNPGEFSKTSLTLLLPRLSYQACGGTNTFPTEISAAWYLFYLAADLMDGIQDQDSRLFPEVNRLSPPELLSMASSFFFMANALLVEMLYQEYDLGSVRSVLQMFQNKLLEMCEGQQQDLSYREVSLSDYLEMLRRKSGSFFSLACYTGARMASNESKCLECISDFGTHVGCIIQILDDLEDWHRLQAGDNQILRKMDWYKNLPAVYTLEVLPLEEKASFRSVIERVTDKPDERQTYIAWIDRSGAALYTMTLLIQEAELAKKNLQSGVFVNTPKETLTRILHTLVGEM